MSLNSLEGKQGNGLLLTRYLDSSTYRLGEFTTLRRLDIVAFNLNFHLTSRIAPLNYSCKF